MGKENTQDIWYTEKDEHGEWTESVHMGPPLNNHRFNQVLNVLDDGNTLLLRGGRSKKDPGLSMTYRIGDKWAKTEDIEIDDYVAMNKGRFSGGVMTSDQECYRIVHFSSLVQYYFADQGGCHVLVTANMSGYQLSFSLCPFSRIATGSRIRSCFFPK